MCAYITMKDHVLYILSDRIVSGRFLCATPLSPQGILLLDAVFLTVYCTQTLFKFSTADSYISPSVHSSC